LPKKVDSNPNSGSEEMKKIGFIGLGIMGSGMAGVLLKAGYEVMVWNRTESKADELIRQGAKWAGDRADMAVESDVIFTMLSADSQVLDVLIGDEGIIHRVKPGQIIIDSSTVSPDTSRLLYRRFAEEGVSFLEAPVTGSAPHAQEGTLGFMVGGDREIFEQCEELFRTLGKTCVYMGSSGNATTAKLASNTMVAIHLVALSEALAIVEKAGIHPEDFIRVISAGGAYSRVVDAKAPKIMSRNYSTDFAASLMNKDLGLASALAGRLGVAAPALGLAKQLLQMTAGKGLGDQDVSALYELYREWSAGAGS
jgi:3-hydroxyisobutyrate dehydrogenase-like beta-hydroxyacid dehydrogenase